MKVDVKEISKLTLEPDEILIIEFAGQPSLAQLESAQETLTATLPVEWQGRVLVASNIHKMTKVKRVNSSALHGVDCTKVFRNHPLTDIGKPIEK